MNNSIDIHQLDSARQVLSILDEAEDYLSITQIKGELITKGISPEEQSMRSTLNTIRDIRKKFIKDGLVHKTKKGYKIMQKGTDYLRNTIIIIDPQNTDSNYSAKHLAELIASLSGDIKICDPYFHDAGYELLKENLNKNKLKSVQILCGKNRLADEKNRKIGAITIEIRNRGNQLHDRFLLDNSKLYILGASLNGVGKKLSFIIDLTVNKQTFKEIFCKYWASE